MSIAKMSLVKAEGKKELLNEFIFNCCTDGNFHVEQAADFVSAWRCYTPMVEDNLYLQLVQYIEEVCGNAGIMDMLKAEQSEVNALPEKSDTLAEDYLKKFTRFSDELNKMSADKSNLEQQLSFCQNEIDMLKAYSSFDVDIDKLAQSKFLKARFGHMPKSSLAKLDAYSDDPSVCFVPCSENESDVWGLYVAPRKLIGEVDRIFSELYFEKTDTPKVAGTASNAIKELEVNVGILRDGISDIQARISDFWQENKKECADIYSVAKCLSEIYEIRKNAAVHNGKFIFVGWIIKDDCKAFGEKAEKVAGVKVEMTDYDKNNMKATPPTRLKNSFLARPYEMFVDMYGMPSYEDIDVTAFVAITYSILFGMMFGDLGQGLVLAVLGWLGWKLKKIKLCRILIPCGLSATVFGFIYGSCFGFEDMLDPLYKALGMSGKPLPVMESINTILILAIGVGVFMVVAVMLLNIIVSLRNKEIGKALFTENGVVGVVFYLAAVSAVYKFMGGPQLIPKVPLVIMLVVPLACMFFKEIIVGIIDGHQGWKPKKWGEFIMQNFFETFEYILSYFSNTVSYLRLGAFVIVHASMMAVVFTLAGDTHSVKGIVVVVIGNIVVMGLEALLTGIQGLRLEFYEMFSRFYKGEGRPFKAVTLKSKINKSVGTKKAVKDSSLGGK